MGVGSRTFSLPFFVCVGLGADVLFCYRSVAFCGSLTEKNWRSSNGRGRMIMWHFVNRSLYLSEGGEFVSRFSSSQFPYSLHSYHLFNFFMPPSSLSPNFCVSVS